MLKIRVIPFLLLQDDKIVKSHQLQIMDTIGDPVTIARIFNEWEADELIILDITASRKNLPPDFRLMGAIAYECFMPLTIGGGIHSMSDVDWLFHIGADKIALNTYAAKHPKFIREVANKYGSQAVVVSIDAKKVGNDYQVFVGGGTIPTKMSPVEWAKQAEKYGAGEILITSIDRDGTQAGYDIELLYNITQAVHIPVIVAGGAGKPSDFVEAVQVGKANAVCASSMFFTLGRSIHECKKYMQAQGLAMNISQLD